MKSECQKQLCGFQHGTEAVRHITTTSSADTGTTRHKTTTSSAVRKQSGNTDIQYGRGAPTQWITGILRWKSFRASRMY
ncbi:hypothetical protein [Paenibacillus lactis]|uniref:hypothetical protein n=1 Tax=Paenibacillus lactis TaxID=228574 RepID=UPI0011A3A708